MKYLVSVFAPKVRAGPANSRAGALLGAGPDGEATRGRSEGDGGASMAMTAV